MDTKIEVDIQPLDKAAMQEAWKKIDNLTKPIGSLGRLEYISAKIAGITGKLNNKINKKNIIIMCADNGVVDEGVSTCPQDTTAIVTQNFTKGITGVCALADYHKSDITVVDIGVKVDFSNPKILNRKVAYGTNNMVNKPAMKREDAIKCIQIGIDIVDDIVKEGYDLIGTGEMGIGNTTTSAAVLSALSGIDPELLVGMGAGLTESQHQNKKDVVKKAITVNKPDKNDVIDVLSKVGGFDIAGLCGCFLGAAKNRVPIVIDGFISSVAALCAYKINPLSKEYILGSHLSAEKGSSYVIEELGIKPMLNLEMRLGEGSGCPLAFNIIESALYTINKMATFEEAELKKDNYVDIRDEKMIN